MMTFAVEFDIGRSLTRAQQLLRWTTTIDMGRKEGAAVPISRCVELAIRLTQCGLGQDLLPYQVASSSMQPFGHNRHGPKIVGCSPLGEQGELDPHLTECRLG